MILSDFLSRQKHDDSNPHEITPISFSMQNVLQTRYYNIGEREQGQSLVQTRSQTKNSGIILPEVHCIDKGMDPNIRPEKQVIKPLRSRETKGISQITPRLGQGRAGMKRKMFHFPVSQPHVKPEQPKLLPGRRPLIQITERPPLQQPQNINQSKQDKKFQ